MNDFKNIPEPPPIVPHSGTASRSTLSRMRARRPLSVTTSTPVCSTASRSISRPLIEQTAVGFQVHEKINVANKGLVIIDPGEFAVVATRERVHCGPRVAAQIGLCSSLARDGLVLLSGPQIDPGFNGVLIVRVTNLAPKRITMPHQARFLTVQFFRLNHAVDHPYDGPRQGQTGLRPDDLRELAHPDSPTLGGMVRSLSALARDVSDLKTSVKWMGWAIPIIVGLGITVIGIIVALK